MKQSEIKQVMEAHDKMVEALSVTVKLGFEEVFKLVIKDLIKKRNSPANTDISAFDTVLKYYLGEKDFEKYVIKGKKIT